MERDLLAAGYRLSDLGTRLTLAEFTHFVVYSPPGTAVFHRTHEGWSVGDHLLAMLLDSSREQVWMRTEDALKPPELQEHRPMPTPRPGVDQQAPVHEPTGMTVADYLERIGEGA